MERIHQKKLFFGSYLPFDPLCEWHSGKNSDRFPPAWTLGTRLGSRKKSGAQKKNKQS